MDTITARRSYRVLLFIYTFIIVVLGAGLAGVGLILLFPKNLGEGYEAVLTTVQGLEQVLLAKVGITYAVLSVFIVIAVIVLHLFYSHRIAGPAFRLGRESRVIGEGNLRGNIRFRRKDNLTDMGDSLNQVASRYHDRIRAIRDHLSLIEAQSKSVADLARQGRGEPAAERTIDEIALNIKSLEKVLSEPRV